MKTYTIIQPNTDQVWLDFSKYRFLVRICEKHMSVYAQYIQIEANEIPVQDEQKVPVDHPGFVLLMVGYIDH